MSNTRRRFFQDAAVLGAGLFGINSQLRARTTESQSHGHTARNTPLAASPPMLTPDVPDLPYKMDGATKVFHLIAEPVQCKIAPFKTLDVWGYNGSCPGPTIQVQQGDRVPNTAAMEFNWLTFNGVSARAITPMLARLGSRVRLRIVNLGMDHHPIHLHGNQFVVTGTEGGRAPESTWYPMNTVLVGVAQARVIEFEAKYPGAWMVHCHLPHHMMNSMMDLLPDRQAKTTDKTTTK